MRTLTGLYLAIAVSAVNANAQVGLGSKVHGKIISHTGTPSHQTPHGSRGRVHTGMMVNAHGEVEQLGDYIGDRAAVAPHRRTNLIRAETFKDATLVNTGESGNEDNQKGRFEEEHDAEDEYGTDIVEGPYNTAGESHGKVKLAEGWTTRAEEYGTPTWEIRTGFCFVSGAIKGTTWALLGTLPEKCRPKKQLVFNQNAGAVTARVEVLKNGEIHYKGGAAGRKAGWVSLSGIVFGTVTIANAILALGWQWSGVGGAYGNPTYSLHKGFCLLEGAVKGTKWGPIGVLPEECFPRKRLAFNVNNGDAVARVDILPDGQIQWVAGGKDPKMLSLSGIVFETGGEEMETLPTQGDWQGFWGQFGGATLSVKNGVCTVEALMKGSAWGHIATLPANCRPKSRLVFNVNNNQFTTQVDVFPNGHVKYIAGGKSHSFISLSNIMFPVKVPVLVGPQGKAGVPAPAAKAIDCQFFEWMVWSECTVSCSGGSTRRERAVKVWPQNDGKNCPGVNLEVKTCKTKSCPAAPSTTKTTTTSTSTLVKASARRSVIHPLSTTLLAAAVAFLFGVDPFGIR